jgi:hypothetical protein
MAMRMYRICFSLLFIFWGTSAAGMMGDNHFLSTHLQVHKYYHFSLLAPDKNTTVTEGPLTFMWEDGRGTASSNFYIEHYEVTFWSKRREFGKSFTVTPNDSIEGKVCLTFDDCRKVFRRHGRYYWRVTAFDTDGNQIHSEVWSFIVGIPEVRGVFTPWTYLYAVRFRYSHRLHTPEYREFLSNLQPSTNLRSFSDLGIVLRQSGSWLTFMEAQEKFYILSHVGVGCEFSSRFRLLKNLYFSLYPQGSAESCWFAMGLEDYSSTMYSVRIGCDLVIMPSGYLSFRSSWVPAYRVRYSEKGRELRTFMGEGWEMGIRIIISRNILSTFRFLGMEIDFRRIPLEFYFSQIRDQYSGTLMKMQRLSIAYLLQ